LVPGSSTYGDIINLKTLDVPFITTTQTPACENPEELQIWVETKKSQLKTETIGYVKHNIEDFPVGDFSNSLPLPRPTNIKTVCTTPTSSDPNHSNS
jgi:hypothetical protein